MSLHLAKGKPRTLAYGSVLRHDLKLLEVSEDLLQELQETGLCFKGGPGEEAVFCSHSKTFAVKNVETTNLVLMVDPSINTAPTPPPPSPSEAPTPPGQIAGLATQKERDSEAASQPPVVVSAIVKSHMELVQAAPRLHALKTVLDDRPIGKDDDDVAAPRDVGNTQHDTPMDVGEKGEENGVSEPLGRTFEELLAVVQASSDELEAALEEKGAVCIDGRWRGVDPSYLGTLLELILLTVVEQGWSLDAVPAEGAAEVLTPHGYLPEVTKHCLRRFSKPVLEKKEGGVDKEESMQEGVYALHAEAVCRHFGVKLLEERSRFESLAGFEFEWKKVVPEGMTHVPRLELLRGEALIDPEGGTGVQWLPVGKLPQDAGTRFQELFKIQSRWELPMLEPYIEGLAGPGETMEMLLLKYARMSQQRPTDPITYSAR